MRDTVIVHPGAVCVMVRLLPKLYKEGHSQVSLRGGPCEFGSKQSVFPTCVLCVWLLFANLDELGFDFCYKFR